MVSQCPAIYAGQLSLVPPNTQVGEKLARGHGTGKPFPFCQQISKAAAIDFSEDDTINMIFCDPYSLRTCGSGYSRG
jgi:hypothetical protein